MESRMTDGLFWAFPSSVLSHHVASALLLVIRMQVRLQVSYSAAMLPNQFVLLSEPCLMLVLSFYCAWKCRRGLTASIVCCAALHCLGKQCEKECPNRNSDGVPNFAQNHGARRP